MLSRFMSNTWCTLLRQAQRLFSSTTTMQATLNQIKRGSGPPRRKKISTAPQLDQCPQRKGVVLRVMVLKPKKPNSAQRKACRVRLTNGKRGICIYTG
ncbi:CPS_collapsed_G0049520.mRNA.1.CDS.1 [Saccharomyces cerevisiae]|nr:CPS_collapsed_G0049520.mRNA.1.CDS.1 [Saccharomyces cerevisiae]